VRSLPPCRAIELTGEFAVSSLLDSVLVTGHVEDHRFDVPIERTNLVDGARAILVCHAARMRLSECTCTLMLFSHV
jgi:hypothetical protein